MSIITTELIKGLPDWNQIINENNDILVDVINQNTTQLSDIRHLNVAYVETWGDDSKAELGRIGKPFKTINAALDAIPILGGYNIMIGMGVFAPIDSAKFKDNISLIGSKKPTPNLLETALENGTIIQGYTKIVNHHNVTIEKIGFDYGLDVANNLYEGIADNALCVASTNVNAPVKGLIIRDIICLAKDPYVLFHACLLECITGAVINNVETHFGTHGFVLKGTFCKIGIVTAWDSAGDAVIIRANSYAPCSGNNIDSIIIKSTNGNTGGLVLDGDESGITLGYSNINNVIITDTSFGIRFYGTDTGKVVLFNINNVILDSIENNAIEFQGSCSRININNIFATGLKGNGIVQSVGTNRVDITKCRLVSMAINTVGVAWNGSINNINELEISGFTTPQTISGSNHKIDNCDLEVTSPVFLNGYNNVHSTNSQGKYYKEGRTIFLEGLILAGTIGITTPIFTLNEGYIAEKSMYYKVYSETGFAEIIIEGGTGNVLCKSCQGAYFSLDAIKFRVN